MNWVHIGMGNIGKGLVVPRLIDQSCIDLKVMDRNLTKGSFVFSTESGGVNKIYTVEVIDFDELSRYESVIVSTSVIVANVGSLLDKIQRLNIKNLHYVPFENSDEAVKIARKKGLRVFKSVVDKIVFEGNFNYVKAESFSNLKIDAKIRELVDLDGDLISENIELDHKLKFFLVNGIHAAIAYVSSANAMIKIGEYFDNPLFIDEIRESYLRFSVANIGIDQLTAEEYIETSITRFRHSGVDSIARIGRNPQLKLQRGERLEPVFEYGSKKLVDVIHAGAKLLSS